VHIDDVANYDTDAELISGAAAHAWKQSDNTSASVSVASIIAAGSPLTALPATEGSYFVTFEVDAETATTITTQFVVYDANQEPEVGIDYVIDSNTPILVPIASISNYDTAAELIAGAAAHAWEQATNASASVSVAAASITALPAVSGSYFVTFEVDAETATTITSEFIVYSSNQPPIVGDTYVIEANTPIRVNINDVAAVNAAGLGLAADVKVWKRSDNSPATYSATPASLAASLGNQSVRFSVDAEPSTSIVSIFTVYANYRLSYSGNGNSAGSAPAAFTYLNGSLATVAPQGSLARSGYSFAGWSKLANATVASYRSGDRLLMDSDITLYAVWSFIPLTYQVLYDANGGTGAVPSDTTSYSAGDTVTVKTSPTPTRRGFDFAGWARAQGSTTPTTSFVIDSNVTLYAIWETVTTDTVVTPPTPLASPGDADLLPDQAAPLVDILGAGVPLMAPAGSSAWSLFDLLAAILAVLCAALGVLRFFLRRRREEDEGAYANKRTRMSAIVIGILCALVSVLIFVVTQNIALPMVLFDAWSTLFALLAIICIATAVLCVKRQQRSSDDDDQNSQTLHQAA
jgi:uncharacterized repeat protein (TIGR02543 family)